MLNGFLSVCAFCIIVLLLLAGAATSVVAQSTAFTYQGKLSDSGNLANGNYDLQFKLFDTVAVGTGTQQGTTITLSNVTVSNGIFTVQLDFGVCASCFNGAARFLEIAVKPTSSGTFTILGPRQPITATPYTIRSLSAASADIATNATQLGGLAASGFIQNTTSQQASTDFNISGNGTVGGTLTGSVINAATQYNLNGSRVLSVSGGNNQFQNTNTFAGIAAGISNMPSAGTPSGNYNSFYGRGAGQSNTTGGENSFFGAYAGDHNTTGNGNSFFGEFSGEFNTTGSNSSFFGSGAGFSNTTGSSNSFFGQQSGNANTTGSNNSFFGEQAGFSNTTGGPNAFFGTFAGWSNTTGNFNAFFGGEAGSSNTDGGFNAFFGEQAGFSNSSGFGNAFFGTFAGFSNSFGFYNAFFGDRAGNLASGSGNTLIGAGANFNTNGNGDRNTLLGYESKVSTNLKNATAIGAFASVTQSNSLILGPISGVNNCNFNNNCNSANVGIGTTAPQRKLHLSDTAASSTALLLENTSSAGPFLFLNYGSTGEGTFWTGLDSANTSAILTTKPFVLGANGGMILSGSNGGEHMRITPGGNLGIGTTTPNAKLHVVGGNSVGVIGSSTNSYGVFGDSGSGIGVVGRSTTGYAGYFFGDVFVEGTVTQSSDARLKQNISTLNYGLPEVLRLRPVTWRWKAHPERGPQLGLVAQEVEPVLPELVSTAKDAEQTKGVNYTGLLPVLVKAVQEQQQQLDQQQAHIREQKAEIETLQKELRQVKQQKELIQQQQHEMAAIKQLLCASHPEAEFCKAKSVK